MLSYSVPYGQQNLRVAVVAAAAAVVAVVVLLVVVVAFCSERKSAKRFYASDYYA